MGELALQKDFTYQCITGKKNHSEGTWFGLVRLIKNPQRWANKFFSTFIDILDSYSKGGVMVETNAVLGSDVREFENKWSRSDSVIWVYQGALQNNRIVPKPTAVYAQAVDRLMEFSIQSIHDVSGVNLELLGSLDRGDVGMVVDSRKRSAYTILAPFFDSLKKYREKNAILLCECIKKFMPPEKMQIILKENLKPLIEQVKMMDLNQLSVVISESPQSENNRYMTWLFISQTLPQLIQMGVPVPPEILEYSPLPAGLIESWKKMLAMQVKKFGLKNACINLGGNIYVLGAPHDKTAWKIGIQHPRNKDEILGYLELRDEATATSGDYERFFEIKGIRYSHIVNPLTGRPVTGTIATTIVAPTGTEVDALSTSLFVMGHEKGLELVKKIPNVHAMIIYEGNDGKIMIEMPKGFADKFKKSPVKGEDNVKWHVVASHKQ